MDHQDCSTGPNKILRKIFSKFTRNDNHKNEEKNLFRKKIEKNDFKIKQLHKRLDEDVEQVKREFERSRTSILDDYLSKRKSLVDEKFDLETRDTNLKTLMKNISDEEEAALNDLEQKQKSETNKEKKKLIKKCDEKLKKYADKKKRCKDDYEHKIKDVQVKISKSKLNSRENEKYTKCKKKIESDYSLMTNSLAEKENHANEKVEKKLTKLKKKHQEAREKKKEKFLKESTDIANDILLCKKDIDRKKNEIEDLKKEKERKVTELREKKNKKITKYERECLRNIQDLQSEKEELEEELCRGKIYQQNGGLFLF